MSDNIRSIEEYVSKAWEENTSYRQYTEEDYFVINGEPVFGVLDLWRYAYSQLNNMRPQIAEFLVAQALEIKKAENSSYWTAYDMSYRNKRVEVKETSYVHPWNKKKISDTRTFSIAPSKNEYWFGNVPEDIQLEEYSRQSDVYVFCLNTDKNIESPSPLNLDYWEFYVVPTFKINRYAVANGNPNQKTIGLNAVKKLSLGCADFNGLKAKIDEAINMPDRDNK